MLARVGIWAAYLAGPGPYIVAGAFAYLGLGLVLLANLQGPRALVDPEGRERGRWGCLAWAVILAAWPVFLALWAVNTWRADAWRSATRGRRRWGGSR